MEGPASEALREDGAKRKSVRKRLPLRGLPPCGSCCAGDAPAEAAAAASGSNCQRKCRCEGLSGSSCRQGSISQQGRHKASSGSSNWQGRRKAASGRDSKQGRSKVGYG
ncbi:MAG: hypothetical protein SPH62_07275 [Candidatus Egerieousia sp.]|nr:hypothetical protein [bacterium]MDY5256184.1 hypothetical protein [Candidatus Egerieousia sp.]